MKKIYLLISHTGTFPARFMSYFTKDTYTHVSIALSDKLNEMYSFGRKYTRFPFPGGFIRESWNCGVYKRFDNTRSVLLEFSVGDAVYEKISNRLRTMYEEREKYKYNLLGIFYAYFGKNRKKENYFYCSEFVEEIFCEYGLKCGDNKTVVKPIDFLNASQGRLVYKGLLREYCAQSA